MLNNNMEKSSHSIGVIDLLVILFIGLKLAGIIDWSWWLVLAGWWVQFVFAGIVHSLLILERYLRKSNRSKKK